MSDHIEHTNGKYELSYRDGMITIQIAELRLGTPFETTWNIYQFNLPLNDLSELVCMFQSLLESIPADDIEKYA